MHRVRYMDLGLKDYKETWDFQQQLQSRLILEKATGYASGEMPCLIFVEHPHVYTLGKSGKENNLLINPQFLESIHAAYFKIDRGGDITYHGPGQIVGYPLFDLDSLHIGVKKYIEKMEEAIILTLAEFGIRACRMHQATGVWIDSGTPVLSRKICAIGVKVSRGITMHGFALNVATDLTYFNYIHPCGFTDKGVTSIKEETGREQEMAYVKERLLKNLAQIFEITIVT